MGLPSANKYRALTQYSPKRFFFTAFYQKILLFQANSFFSSSQRHQLSNQIRFANQCNSKASSFRTRTATDSTYALLGTPSSASVPTDSTSTSQGKSVQNQKMRSVGKFQLKIEIYLRKTTVMAMRNMNEKLKENARKIKLNSD